MPTLVSAEAASETQREWGDLSPEAVFALQRMFDLVRANGVKLFVDSRKDIQLRDGEQRVYPFVDEAAELLRTAQRVVREDGDVGFKRVIDCFAGGGNSMLPILQEGIADRGFGIDLNRRAVDLAQFNAQLNGLKDRATFMNEDVNKVTDSVLSSDERTLFIANPPFALTTQADGTWDTDGIPNEERLMRDGGRNGLTLTRAYVTQALAKAYVAQTMEYAKPGDVIIGVAYSRIGVDEHVELEEELQTLVGDRGEFVLELVEGEKLWRGANGKKEQDNPMSLTQMHVKGTTASQKAEYDRAAANHLTEGYDRLGYYRYIIRVGKTSRGREDVRGSMSELLASPEGGN